MVQRIAFPGGIRVTDPERAVTALDKPDEIVIPFEHAVLVIDYPLSAPATIPIAAPLPLGFTRGEVRAMLLGEQTIVTLAGIPLSIAIGTLCVAWLTKLFQAERHRFPMVVNTSTYAIATIVVFVAAIGAGLAIRRRLDALDLVAVLKTRE